MSRQGTHELTTPTTMGSFRSTAYMRDEWRAIWFLCTSPPSTFVLRGNSTARPEAGAATGATARPERRRE